MITTLIALVTLGFGHRHAESQPSSLDAATLAFVNAGGELSDICQEGREAPGVLTECPVCTLAGVFHIPAGKTAGFEAPQSFEKVAFLPGHTEAVPTPLDHARASRAPPVI